MVLLLAETEMETPNETILQFILEQSQARQLYRALDLSLGFLWKKVPGTHLITKEALFFESFSLLDFCVNHTKFMRQLFPLKRQILLDDRLYENARSQKLLAGFCRGNSSSMGSSYGNWMQEFLYFSDDLVKLDAALFSGLSNASNKQHNGDNDVPMDDVVVSHLNHLYRQQERQGKLRTLQGSTSTYGDFCLLRLAGILPGFCYEHLEFVTLLMRLRKRAILAEKNFSETVGHVISGELQALERFSIPLTLSYLAFLGDLPSLIASYDYCYEKGLDLADFSETLDPQQK